MSDEGGDTLSSLLSVLNQVELLLQDGRQRYDAELTIRLSLQRLWIIAGEAVRRHCRAEGIDDGIEPWSEISRLRDYLAHHILDEIDDGRLWAESAGWVAAHLGELRTRAP